MCKLIIWVSELMDLVERNGFQHTQKIAHLWMSVILNIDLCRFVFVEHVISVVRWLSHISRIHA